MSGKHTPGPGPWALTLTWNGLEVKDANGSLVYSEDRDDIPDHLDAETKDALWAEVVANARLIAASQAMLEALKGLVGTAGTGERFDDRIKKAHAAIRLAEPEGK